MSPYLQSAIARAKLPVFVRYSTLFSRFQVISAGLDGGDYYTSISSHPKAEDAARAYLRLCDVLSDPADRLPSAGTAEGCSGTSPDSPGAL